jgi:hypothetical protein
MSQEIHKTEKFVSDKLPNIDDKEFCGRKIKIVAVGTRIKQKPIHGEVITFLSLDKKYFIFSEKGEYRNGTIVKK